MYSDINGSLFRNNVEKISGLYSNHYLINVSNNGYFADNKTILVFNFFYNLQVLS